MSYSSLSSPTDAHSFHPNADSPIFMSPHPIVKPRNPRSKAVHKCPSAECAKIFRSSGHLNRHIKIHTGERPHGCPWPDCEMRCSRLDNLMQHYSTHVPKSKRLNKVYVRKAYADMQASISSPESDDSPVSLPVLVASPEMIKEEPEELDLVDEPPLTLSLPVALPSPLLLDDGADSPADEILYALPTPIDEVFSSVPQDGTVDFLDFLDYPYSPYQLPSPPLPPAHSSPFRFPSSPSVVADTAGMQNQSSLAQLSYHYQWPNFPPPPPATNSFQSMLSLGPLDFPGSFEASTPSEIAVGSV